MNRGTTFTLTFSGSGIVAGSLSDGDYTLTIPDAFADASGNALDGNDDGKAGGNRSDDFFRFYGDINADRIVNIVDFLQSRFKHFPNSFTAPTRKMKSQEISTHHMFLVLVFGIACLGRTAHAGLALMFSNDNGASFSNSFAASAGDTVDVGIYLQETAPDTVLSDDGLVGFGLDLAFSPAGSGTVSNALANPFFDFENRNVDIGNGFE